MKTWCMGVLALVLAGCSSLQDKPPELLFKGRSEAEIYNTAQSALHREHYKEAVTAFEGLEALYPFGQYAEPGRMGLIYADYKAKNYPEAVASADHYIHLYPRSPNVAYAYYLRGLANYNTAYRSLTRYLPLDVSKRDLTQAREALHDFDHVVKRYPKSDYAADAGQHLTFLRNELAQHTLNVSEYYLRREAYLAAANRASEVVRHYPRTPQVKKALCVMAKAYRKLGLPKRAQRAEAVLKANYSKG